MKKQMVSIAAAAMLSSAFAAQASADTYVVKKGDTLSQLATKYKTTVPELKKRNNLSSDFLFINQTLQLPGTSKEQKNSKPAVVTPPANSNTNYTYTVKPGDTLSKIALNHKISLVDLMGWNNLSHHIIRPGQVLKVKKSAQSTPAKNTETSAAPPAPTGPAPVVNSTAYIVVKGDTLSTIAVKNKTSVQQIKEWNKLNSDLIYIGQKLVLGGTEQNPSKQPVIEKPAKVENSTANSLLAEAQKHIGVPYKWAGSTPEGFDCSGFIYYVLNKSGSQLGRYSTDGYYSRSYYINQPQPGDLVFFENTYRPGISHMGFYVGDNQFIHASSNGVEVSSLDDPYYKKHFDGFKRFY
ncbi:LysM peptidoglycan-binding domain-containing protein [Cytobacillus oceanisediminis]|uniref:C40 family peptidase n=1 Tax=Cytobacillus oceanisediminis TaxID=665099 RepID=UPI000D712A9A